MGENAGNGISETLNLRISALQLQLVARVRVRTPSKSVAAPLDL